MRASQGWKELFPRTLTMICLALLVLGCASSPRRASDVAQVRAALAAEYPDLLQTFDLTQGEFSVHPAIWDSLGIDERTVFLRDLSRYRRDVCGKVNLRILAGGLQVASFDGATPVYRDFADFTPGAGGIEIAGFEVAAPDSIQPDESPVLLAIAPPRYPDVALEARSEGTVHVKVLIGKTGRTEEVRIVRGGILLLNDAAMAAARTARWRPARKGGEPVRVWVVLPIRFSLDGS